jgi:hypothetical protein
MAGIGAKRPDAQIAVAVGSCPNAVIPPRHRSEQSPAIRSSAFCTEDRISGWSWRVAEK